MSNDIEITPGSGKIVASEDTGGHHYQVVKLASGTAASEERIGGDAANGLDADVTRFPPDGTSSGSITANGVSLAHTPAPGAAGISATLSGTWTGTLEIEGTTDGTIWNSIKALLVPSTPKSQTTFNGLYLFPAGGLKQVRFRSSAWTSGQVDIAYRSSVGCGPVFLAGALPTGSNDIGSVTATQFDPASFWATVQGDLAHDAAEGTNFPVPIGGSAKAAAPTNVSADGDRVAAWFLRNGAQATVLTAAGALIGGDAANGLDVDVTRLPYDVAHDGVDSGNPFKIGGKCKAAAPSDVSADGDRVDAWFLRNGAQAAVLTAAGALIGGDAANGLDVDVTRLPYDVAHDGVDSGNPIKIGGKCKAAAPSDVSADGDRVDAWFLRNGAQAAVLTAAGALIGGDAANGLDIDVTRFPPETLTSGTFTASSQTLEHTPAPGATTVCIQLTGAWSGGVQFEATRDGSTWTSISLVNNSFVAGSSASGNGIFVGPIGGYQKFRLSSTAWGSGTATLTIASSVGENMGPIPVYQSVGTNLQTATQGNIAHDGVDSGNPLKNGGYAKAAAPADVSADGDRVNAWFLRNGAQAAVLTAAGALIGGDAANGLDIDVTRLPYDVAHDGVDSGNPFKIGGYAKATAPADVSADADRVNAWFLRNGAQAAVLTAAGALIGGDATNGLDVDVTRLPYDVAHDGVDSGNPIKIGGKAKAAAPADVSADGDRVDAWYLRNGSQATVLTAAGALIGGDAANGLDIDVTRLPYDVAHDGVDSGNPIKVGAKAVSTFITAVSDADRTNLITDLYARLKVVNSDFEGKYLGIYYYQTGVHTVLASADSSNVNRWALFNASATVKVRLLFLIFQSQLSSTLAAVSAPRLRLQRFTYTPGTFGGGGAITAGKRKAADATVTATMQSAATFTGGTLVRGSDLHAFFPCASATGVGYMPAGTSVIEFNGENVIELVQNEGVIFDQPDAGTASDTRKFLTTLVTGEY